MFISVWGCNLTLAGNMCRSLTHCLVWHWRVLQGQDRQRETRKIGSEWQSSVKRTQRRTPLINQIPGSPCLTSSGQVSPLEPRPSEFWPSSAGHLSSAVSGMQRWQKNRERLLAAISRISSPATESAPSRPPVPTTVSASFGGSDWIQAPTGWMSVPSSYAVGPSGLPRLPFPPGGKLSRCNPSLLFPIVGVCQGSQKSVETSMREIIQ